MPRRRGTRRNGRGVNHRSRRNAILEEALTDSDHPPSIVDSAECSTSSLSSATEDYVANLAENASSSDETEMNIVDRSEEVPQLIAPQLTAAQRNIISECSRAYDVFCAPDRTETQFKCLPTKKALHRLALHKAAELMGATSESSGNGKDRSVVMTMDIGSEVSLSRESFQGGLEAIANELFSALGKKGRKERQSDRKRRRQVERRHREVDSFLNDSLRKKSSRAPGRSKRNRGRMNTVEQRVDQNNVGYGMLERMGWREGQGLGAQQHGLREPLEAEHRRTRAGLGI
ncbi:hypothetical protein BWQ96_03048 [Gracilariopsis chorda]|uniref:G-patch domain-containing protein n=1 Tax=Gracilariopsis chorda TaxID=448386 RepID=A0A2V3IY73_9FLOR|nr:hypothetical protein BWQ96_03048 [Gracilariopsis chorda]|eukprot:PXF47106.1 hypothetical protein BWQ96_03048 [Gracilariopsis chorda]